MKEEDLYTPLMSEIVPRLQLLPPQVDVKKIKPFLKWPGGKRQLLKRIIPMVPEMDVYHEPFIGGGALFFELRSQRMIRESAHLSDLLTELITTYRVVQSQPADLMELLDSAFFVNSKPNYLKVRALDPKRLTPTMVAARMIVLLSPKVPQTLIHSLIYISWDSCCIWISLS